MSVTSNLSTPEDKEQGLGPSQRGPAPPAAKRRCLFQGRPPREDATDVRMHKLASDPQTSARIPPGRNSAVYL